MDRYAILAAGLLACAVLSGADARAETVTGSGTLVMKDNYHSKTAWGTGLTLPREGRIVRVMDGTYGFTIRNERGDPVANFLDPQQAVGMSLPAGSYSIEPYVCARHRHHHIEVTAEY
ncbi:MAG TPA: hypothetical protein PKA57_10180 [Parvibaculum sp.]|uniref:hypothetical protein n=1 Tax=Parvibaculum sp. TaxID=2024848 RepID=UPI002CB1D37D|nr:hypothetical protein [Parvibaculum sp.]HMM14982.1 hypothetical protein [Parvibaculum sp.]